MLTVEQRDELLTFHRFANREANTQSAELGHGIPVPFKRFGDSYYVVSWPALHVAAMCQIVPTYEEFQFDEERAGLLPVVEINIALMGEAAPRLLQPSSPRLMFRDDERPDALERPQMFRMSDGSPADKSLPS